MKANLVLPVIVACLACPLARAELLVSGVVSDCVGGKRYHPQGATVYILDAAKSTQIVKLLRKVYDAQPDPSDSVAVERFFASTDRLMHLVKTSGRLAATKSDASGSFKVGIPASAKDLVIFGFAESVDGPNAYAYSQLHTASRSNIAVSLDFAHGRCGH